MIVGETWIDTKWLQDKFWPDWPDKHLVLDFLAAFNSSHTIVIIPIHFQRSIIRYQSITYRSRSTVGVRWHFDRRQRDRKNLRTSNLLNFGLIVKRQFTSLSRSHHPQISDETPRISQLFAIRGYPLFEMRQRLILRRNKITAQTPPLGEL